MKFVFLFAAHAVICLFHHPVISGGTAASVAKARSRVRLIIEGSRSRLEWTHLLNIPLNIELVKARLADFKGKVLKKCGQVCAHHWHARPLSSLTEDNSRFSVLTSLLILQVYSWTAWTASNKTHPYILIIALTPLWPSFMHQDHSAETVCHCIAHLPLTCMSSFHYWMATHVELMN